LLPLLLAGVLLTTGCVRRTLTIETEPQGALVHLNDQEVGVTPVSTDFSWYGDYDVIIRKEGFDTVHSHVDLKPPWYQLFPIDFFFDVLWPGRIHDVRYARFDLAPRSEPDTVEVVQRAKELRDRALLESDHE